MTKYGIPLIFVGLIMFGIQLAESIRYQKRLVNCTRTKALVTGGIQEKKRRGPTTTSIDITYQSGKSTQNETISIPDDLFKVVDTNRVIDIGLTKDNPSVTFLIHPQVEAGYRSYMKFGVATALVGAFLTWLGRRKKQSAESDEVVE